MKKIFSFIFKLKSNLVRTTNTNCLLKRRHEAFRKTSLHCQVVIDNNLIM